MQSSSFLDYQRRMQKEHGGNNARSLFGVHQIPSTQQIRNLLDPATQPVVTQRRSRSSRMPALSWPNPRGLSTPIRVQPVSSPVRPRAASRSATTPSWHGATAKSKRRLLGRSPPRRARVERARGSRLPSPGRPPRSGSGRGGGPAPPGPDCRRCARRGCARPRSANPHSTRACGRVTATLADATPITSCSQRTRSPWGMDPMKPAFTYPHQPDDGKPGRLAAAEDLMPVVRGERMRTRLALRVVQAIPRPKRLCLARPVRRRAP